MHGLCLRKIGADKSDQAIGPELQNANLHTKFVNMQKKIKFTKALGLVTVTKRSFCPFKHKI